MTASTFSRRLWQVAARRLTLVASVALVFVSADRAIGTRGTVIAAGRLESSATAATDATDGLFDATQLQEIRLWINTRDLAQLRTHFDENTFYPADLWWRGTRVRNVGVRSRGFGSRNPVKIGLFVDLDRYTTGQQLAGVSAFVLDNFWQDPSMLREFLAMAFFNRMGVPAPREAFARLYVNNVYEGVYALVEDIDARFIARTLGRADGTLFEYHWTRPFFGEDLGDLNAYVPMFEPRTHEQDAPGMLWGPLADWWRAVNGPDDAAWRAEVSRYVDLEQFVTQAAIENYLAENDGLLGYAGMDNFYCYREPGTTRHRLFPWDKDTAFLQVDFAPYRGVDENRLMLRAMAQPDLRALYESALLAAAALDSDEAWLLSRADAAAALIRDAAYADPRKRTTNDEFAAAVQQIRDFATNRAAFIRDRLSGR